MEKKKMKKAIVTSISTAILMTNIANAESNIIVNEKGLKISRISENTILIEEQGNKSICTFDTKNNTAIIKDEKGNKSHINTEIESYDKEGNIKKCVSKIDGEHVITLEESTNTIDESNKEEILKDIQVQSKARSVARARYNYTFLHRYKLTVNATKSIAIIASSIASVVGIYAGYADVVSVAQLIVQGYKEFNTVKYPPISINVLYAKDAPTPLQIKTVFRIYKDASATKLLRMYTTFRAIS